MRIIRSPGLPAVVAVKGRGVSTVAIPDNLPSDEILMMASLVLSTGEYEEFRHAVEAAIGREPAAAVGAGIAQPSKPLGALAFRGAGRGARQHPCAPGPACVGKGNRSRRPSELARTSRGDRCRRISPRARDTQEPGPWEISSMQGC